MPALRRLMSRVWASGGAIAVVDQAVVSAGNFGTSVLVARAVDPTAFGVFVLATYIPLLILQLQYGLLTSPLTINGAAMDSESFGRFLRANVWLQLGFTAVATVALAIVAAVWEPLQAIAIPLLVLSALWQVQEFVRRVLYTRGLIRAALLNNLINYDVQVVCLLAVALWSEITVERALWISVATSAVAVAIGLVQLRPLVSRWSAPLLATTRATFALGKWTATTGVLVAATHQGATFLVALLDGLAGAAALGIMYQLIGPVHLLGRPLQNYFMPTAIRALAADGARGLDRVLRQAVALTGPGYIGYTLVLAAVPGLFLATLYAGKYTEYADAVRIFAIMQMVAFAELVLIMELNVRRLQRDVFWGFALFAAIQYSVGWFLTVQAGVYGLVWTLTGATVAQVVFFAVVVARARRAA